MNIICREMTRAVLKTVISCMKTEKSSPHKEDDKRRNDKNNKEDDDAKRLLLVGSYELAFHDRTGGVQQ